MKLCTIGTGFVGVVSAAVFASFGNDVIGLDIDEKKVAKLKNGEVPFYEPGLKELLLEQQAAGNLRFTTDYSQAIPDADVIMIAVGTPSATDGQADLRFVFAAGESLAPHLKDGAIIAIKSTVPPGTLQKFAEKITPLAKVKFHLASLPEFLKEGTAVQDTLHPDRIVIGATEEVVFEKLKALHHPFNAPMITTSPASAQMAKYAANAYLATRITFINQIADLCEKNGADVQEVIAAISPDKRIGSHYWYPGFGYGGSCFPKDVKELAAYSRAVGEEDNLLNRINTINEGRIEKLLAKFGKEVGGWENKRVAVLGLSFKPNTDDMREAPSVKVIPYLLHANAQVVGFDPKALRSVSYFVPAHERATYVENIEEAVADVDVIIALIEWPEIVNFDFVSAKNPNKKQWIIDARNQLNRQELESAGYIYQSIGRR